MIKEKIIKWLETNGIDLKGKKMRLIKYRGIPELRIYKEPQSYPNTRKSRRKLGYTTEEGFNCTYGVHSKMLTMYIHITIDDIERAEKDPDEKEFLLEQFKY